jgi:hypothetical protein
VSLPDGTGPGHEVNLADDEVIDEFEKLLDAGGSSASLSGEEYRRRLYGRLRLSALDLEWAVSNLADTVTEQFRRWLTDSVSTMSEASHRATMSGSSSESTRPN